MATKTTVPIPREKIEECFVWRDWFQRLSDKVFGSMASQDANNVVITGGTLQGINLVGETIGTSTINDCTIDNTPIGLNAPSVGYFLNIKGTGADTTYAYRANNLSDLNSASTARTNLGLGTMSTENIGATGSFKSADSTPKIVTVVNGVITSIV